VDETQLTRLNGNTRPEANSRNDRGPVTPNLEMGDLFLLLRRSPEQQAAFDAFVSSLYEPSSANYHQWLTPDEVGKNFGPAQTDIDAASHWLQNHGFSIDEISKDHLTIRFSGSASQVESAFHTEIHNLHVTYKDGRVEDHVANMTDPQIPTALASAVVGVKALHNFRPRPMHRLGGMARRDPATGGWKRVTDVTSPPETTGSKSGLGTAKPFFGINDPNNGYLIEDVVPYDLAAIYNISPLWTEGIDGTGQTIAIAGTSNINLSDIATFRSAFGLPPNVPTVKITNSDPGDCSNAASSCDGDLTENTLDVEWSGAVAKNASIILVTSSAPNATTDPLYLSEQYIVSNKTANIMNVSYGQCELFEGTTGNATYNSLWESASSEGIAVFVSSGDSGSASCDDGMDQSYGVPYAAEYGLSVNGLGSTPYNTAVGGTDLNWCPPTASTCEASPYWSTSNNSSTLASALGYIPEVPWNNTCTSPEGIAISQSFSSYLSQEGFSVSYPTDAESSCNFVVENYQTIYELTGSDLSSLVDTVGGSGGKSSCTVNSTTDTTTNPAPSSCSGGYAKPTWQVGVTGIPNDGKRDIPDLSFFAANGFLGSAYLICVSANGSCVYSDTSETTAQEVGGTSVASPVMAGVMALINQKSGSPQGSPNTELYKIAATQNYSSCSSETVTNSSSCVFHDVDSSTIAMACDYSDLSANCTTELYSGDSLAVLPGYSAGAGFDNATGLGTANVYNLVNAFAGNATPEPAVTLSATSLTFSSTTVNGTTAPQQTVTLKNTGNAALTVSSIKIAGTDASSFSETNNCSSVAAGSSCTITVGFTPASAGTLTASVSISDNASSSPQSISLSGTGVEPVLVFTPSKLTFAATPEGTSATPLSITVNSTGSASVSISKVALGGTNASSFSIVANSCGSTLSTGSSCTVTIGFKPAATGNLSASLTFTDNASGSPQTVPITGSSTYANASLSTTKLAFGSEIKGSSATNQTVTLKNSGDAKLTISSIAITGANASSFSIASKTCTTSLAPGSCTVTVGFKPAATGALSASLVFTDNSSPTTQTVSLTGTGTAPTATLSASTLTFSGTLKGTAAANQTVTIKNTGTAPLTFTSIYIGSSSSFSLVSKTCATTLAIGGSCTVTIGFKPEALGALTDTLTIGDNASPSPQTVTLKGTGTDPTATFSPTSLTFPSTDIGVAAAKQTVKLTNDGTANLAIDSIAISGTNASAFSIVSKTCSTTLVKYQSCTVTVGFKPASAGKLTASLNFTDNAAGTPQKVALSGTGVAVPAISLSVSTLSFPPTATGDKSPSKTVTVKNTGTGAATISSVAIGGADASSFTQTHSCGTTLAAGASCPIYVTAAPAAAGSLTATLSVTDNASGSPQKVSLSVTGGAAPTVTFSPASLAFGDQKTGTDSAAKTVVLQNTGATTFYITSVGVNGAGKAAYKLTNGCGTSLGPGLKCDLTVVFAPTSTGAASGYISIVANNPSVNKTVGLSGTGD
jgi:subtilase family serine protease